MSLIFDQYIDRLERLNRSESTINMVRFTNRLFDEFLTERNITAEDVESWGVEEFLASLPYAASTKKTILANLRSTYRYAHQRGVIPGVPTTYVQTERIPEQEPDIISNDELRTIKDRCYDSRQWLLFHLYAYTGLRKNEGRELTWENVDLPNATLRIVGKGGKLRLVPIHPILAEILAATSRRGDYILPGRNGTAMSTTGLWQQLQKLAPGHGFHAFRRTVASSLYRNGVQPDTIDRIMGWAPSAIRTRYYQNIAGDLLQQAILCLYKDEPL